MTFFFRTIFTNDREIVVVPKPVGSLVSVYLHSLLHRFVGYCARSTKLLRVLNFHVDIACLYMRSIPLLHSMYIKISGMYRVGSEKITFDGMGLYDGKYSDKLENRGCTTTVSI